MKNENQSSGGRVALAAGIWNLREKQRNEKIQREIQRSIRTSKSQDSGRSSWSKGGIELERLKEQVSKAFLRPW